MLLLLLACTGTAEPEPKRTEPEPQRTEPTVVVGGARSDAPAETAAAAPEDGEPAAPPAVSDDAAPEPADDAAEAPAAQPSPGTEDAAADTTEADEPAEDTTEADAPAADTTEADAPAADTTEADAPAADTTEDGSSAATDEPAADAAPVPATTYTLSSTASTLLVQVLKDPDTVGAGISHDHVVSARGWSGTVTWHPTDPSQCEIDIRVPVSKLVVDAPAMRAAVGYDSELSDSQRSTVKKNMLAADQLNAAAFPDITFSATRCEGTTGAVPVTGTLSIRGKPKTISTTLTVSLEQGFSATGTFTARHTDFGFSPYTAMMGALKNRNQMRFRVTLSAP